MFILFRVVPMILMIPFVYYIFKKLKRILPQTIALGVSLVLFLISTSIFSIGFILVLHIACLSMLVDGIFHLYQRKKELSDQLLKLQRSLILPVLLTALLFTYGYFNMNTVHQKDYTVSTVKDLDRDYRFVFISDVHFGISLDKEEMMSYIEKINQEDLDFVLLGGDIVDESTTYQGVEDVFSVLSKIQSKYGTYLVYGNHDESNYSSAANYTTKQLEDIVLKNGIKLLKDESVLLNDEIQIIGRLDYSYKKRATMESLLENVDESNYLLVLDHQPVGYKENEQLGIDLEISGHTHQGQIFPLGLLIDLFKTSDMCYGYQQINNFHAIVSSGFAGWGYPIRTQGQCEYVIVTIKDSI